MDIVKKNLVSIICGAIAVVAVIAVWPIGGRFTALQEQVNARKGVYDQLKGLLEKERHLPIVSLDPAATPQKLEGFPTEPVIARGTEIKETMKAQADEMFKEAVAINQADKKLLVADALPKPKSNQIPFKFRQEYLREMDYASADASKRKASMPGRLLMAGMKPTDAEISNEIQRQTRLIRQKAQPADPREKVNQQQVNEQIQQMTAAVPGQMWDAASKACQVYVEADTFHRGSGMDTGGASGGPQGLPPSAQQMFYAQLSLWLQEDICRAINSANNGSKAVPESAVKRVIKIDLPDHLGTTTTVTTARPGAGGDDQGGEAPPPAPTDPSQPLEKNYSVSPTGRYSNPLYDVWNFSLSLVVEPEKIPVILQALSKNRFITVYEANITGVDSGAEQAKGYIYGAKPVVQLDLRCEALFLREWTKPLMPQWVKNQLGIVDEPAPTTP